MFKIKGVFTLITLLLVTLYTTGCSKKDRTSLLEQKSIEVQIDTPVRVEAKEGANEYKWRQIEGVRVEIENSNSRVLSFVAPKVEKEQMLKFEITAKYPFSEKKEILRVVVKPLALEDSDDKTDKDGISNGSDDNATTGVDDNDTSTEGSNDNGTGVSDNNGSTESGDDNTSTTALKSLTLKIATTTLNRDHNITITLQATYDDNTTETPTNIEWLINPKDAVAIKGTTLTALKDTNVTIQAKVGNTLSNKVHLAIYWEVNGYRLPPEPDPKINNATLLGVDVNHNGVRDDVERWIYKTYRNPIERGIFMQSARAYQKVIVDPKRAHETTRYIDDAYSCEAYWTFKSQDNNESFKLDMYRDLEKEISKIQFNTIKRHIAYQRFNAEFNGETFDSPKASKDKCQFDENGILKAEQ